MAPLRVILAATIIGLSSFAIANPIPEPAAQAPPGCQTVPASHTTTTSSKKLSTSTSTKPSTSTPTASDAPLPRQYTLSAKLTGNSKLNGLKVEAGGQMLSIGATGPGSYCPTSVQPNCPPGNETVFIGGLYLSVEVPGGQQSYTGPNGAFAYTQAHSTYVPAGSYYGGVIVKSSSQPAPANCPVGDKRYDCRAGLGLVTFNLTSSVQPSGGVFACPSPDYVTDRSILQLFGNVPALNRTGCVELEGLVVHNFTGPSIEAWQY